MATVIQLKKYLDKFPDETSVLILSADNGFDPRSDFIDLDLEDPNHIEIANNDLCIGEQV